MMDDGGVAADHAEAVSGPFMSRLQRGTCGSGERGGRWADIASASIGGLARRAGWEAKLGSRITPPSLTGGLARAKPQAILRAARDRLAPDTYHIAGPYLNAYAARNGVARGQSSAVERRAISGRRQRGAGASGEPPVEGLLAA